MQDGQLSNDVNGPISGRQVCLCMCHANQLNEKKHLEEIRNKFATQPDKTHRRVDVISILSLLRLGSSFDFEANSTDSDL